MAAPTLLPIAILQDRYGGTYSGGLWLAIAEADENDGRALPGPLSRAAWIVDGCGGPYASFPEVAEWWKTPPAWIAVGKSPDEAMKALIAKNEGPDDNWGPKWA